MAQFFDLASLTLGDLNATAKGCKTVPFSLANGAAIFFSTEALRVVYEPSAFGDTESTRVNINWRLTDELEESFGELDEAILKLVSSQALKLFGAARTIEQLRECYTPIVKRSEKWPAQFKAKMNLEEPAKCRIWSEEGQLREPPNPWVNCLTKPKLRLRSLYIMGRQFGPVLELTDLQICEESSSVAACPF